MWRITGRLMAANVCLLLAASIAASFAVIAMHTGKHPLSDIYLGAAWVFTLSLIISSPLLIPRLRKRG